MIRSQNTGPTEIPAAEIISRILEKFRVSQGWRPTDDTDHELRVSVFAEILGTAKIPPRHYDRLYSLAMVTRGRKIGEDIDVSFSIRPEDLIAEYDGLLRELDANAEVKPKPCTEDHIDEVDRLVKYVEWGGINEKRLPCHLCRPSAYAERLSAYLAERAGQVAEVQEKTLRLVGEALAFQIVNKSEAWFAPIDAEEILIRSIDAIFSEGIEQDLSGSGFRTPDDVCSFLGRAVTHVRK